MAVEWSSPDEVTRAAAILRSGGLVAFPTETVYGLGANALDPRAVARIFAAKERPEFDPLIVHVASVAELDALVSRVDPLARRLADCFWPGPLTLLLPKRTVVSDLVTSGLPLVGVRVPAHPLALELLHKSQCPIAAPSANLFGRVSPTTAAHVADQLRDRVDCILDGGPCRVGVESTVVEAAGGRIRILRPGGVTAEAIGTATGVVPSLENRTIIDTTAQASPGLLAQHYAPRTPVTLVTDWSAVAVEPTRDAALVWRAAPPDRRFRQIETLSESGDLAEAASRLFASLRRLDDCGAGRILAEVLPELGLGVAINDRLRRAAAR
jgi:L-threonylcarbamoyladenylate synthase